MKIILLKDVPGTGKRNDVKDVAAGFAGNYLIPNKLATLATDKAVKQLEIQKVKTSEEAEINENLLEKNMGDLSGKSLTVVAKANEEGHLFAGIHKEEISKYIKEKLGLDIPEKYIELEKPIKTTGEVSVTIKVGAKKASFNLKIEKV